MGDYDFYDVANEQTNKTFDNVEYEGNVESLDAKINWKQKLSSRKFWALIVGFITPLLLAFGVADNVVAQVAAIITAGGAVVAYLFAESIVDSAREGATNNFYVGSDDVEVK